MSSVISVRQNSSGSRNFNNFDPNSSEIAASKAVYKQKQIKGFHFAFNGNNKRTQEQQQSPINMLNRSSPQQAADGQQQMDIKRVSSHVVVEENEKENLPLRTSDTMVNLEKKVEPQKLVNILEEEQKIQQLFVQLIQQKTRPFSQLLKFSKGNIQNQQNIKSFFALSQILQRYKDNCQKYINAKKPQDKQTFQQNYTELEAQISNQIIWASINSEKSLQMKYFSELFGQIVSNNMENYTKRLISENNIQKALAAANLTDKTFIKKPNRCARTHFNAQLSCLIGKNLAYLKKSSWILQLGLVAKVLKPHIIFQYGKEIFNRYIDFKEQIFPSQFLLLGLKCAQFCQNSDLIQQRLRNQVKQADIIRLLKASALNQTYVELWLLYILLKKEKKLFQSSFKLAIQQLLKKVHHPKSFFEIIEFSEIQTKDINYFLKFYQSQNKLYKEKAQYKAFLKKYIVDKLSVNKKNHNALKIKEWVLFSDLQQQYQQQRLAEFLNKLVRDFDILEKSDLVNFKKVLLMTKQIITDFRLNCNYKEHKRSQFYQLLIQLESKLKKTAYEELFNLTKGCKALLQLKKGIFCLNDDQQIKSLYYLNQQLVKQAKEQTLNNECLVRRKDSKKLLDYIKKTLLKILETTSGQLYLKKLSVGIKKENQTFKRKAEDFKIQTGSSVLSFSLLTKILDDSKTILTKMTLLTNFG